MSADQVKADGGAGAVPMAVPGRLRGHPKWVLIIGIVFVVIGSLAILMPQVSTLAVELTIGWLFVLSAAAYAWSAFSLRGGWKIAGALGMAALSLVIGLILLLYPLRGILTLTLVMAAFFFAGGGVKVWAALANRQVKGWWWGLISGIASLVIGVIIVAGWPGTATWALGLLFGIDLLFAGWALIAIYPALKGEGPTGP